jgi:hypothetical protein
VKSCTHHGIVQNSFVFLLLSHILCAYKLKSRLRRCVNTDAALTKSPLPKGAGNMATFDVTKKLHIYHTLYQLNLSFASVVAHCRTLQEAGVFQPKFARLYQGLAQELQSEINEDLLGTIHNAELEDWNRFSKVREAREKELSGPNDGLVHAQERKGVVAKRGKKTV